MDGETERQMEEVITQLGPFTSLSLERYTHITRYVAQTVNHCT